MSTRVQLRRGTTAEHATFTGAEGELTVDTEKKSLVVHDGVTVGGNPVGGFSFSSSSGANQSVSFEQSGLHEATCDTPTVTFSFTDADEFAKVDLVLDIIPLETFKLSTSSYDNVSFSVSSQDSNPCDIAFSSDGTKMFMVGDTNDRVYQYTLSTAWDLSTSSYDSFLSVGSQDGNPFGIAFSSDGTKMFMVGNNSGRVYQYTLSTAWDIGSASYDSVSFSVSSQDSNPLGIAFSPDGTKMFILGNSDSVYQYSLGTAWNISTASYDSDSFSVSSQDTSSRDIAFSSDGTKMFMVGSSSDRVYQYYLTTAWDIGSASYDSSFFVQSQDGVPIGIAFSSDGTKMFMVGQQNDRVYQYNSASFSEIIMPNNLYWNPPERFNLGRSKITITSYNNGQQQIYLADPIVEYGV